MATSLSAVIVDDELLARQELEYLLKCNGDVEVVAQGSNGIEAVELIRQHRPDVVFLDVRMPGLDGFAVLRKLLSASHPEPLPQIVFATAFDQYAVKAFEVNAIDYLLKPFDSERLAKTLGKVRERMQPVEEPGEARAERPSPQRVEAIAPLMPVLAAPKPEPAVEERASAISRSRLWEAAQVKLDTLLRMVEQQAGGGAGVGPLMPSVPTRTGRVVLRLGDRLLLVDQKDVCFASIQEGRITVVTKTLEGDSNVRTLEELAEQLDPGQFWRAHRSYLVNLQHIREVMPWFKSSYKLRMDDRSGTEIPVSRSQTRQLRDLFKL